MALYKVSYGWLMAARNLRAAVTLKWVRGAGCARSNRLACGLPNQQWTAVGQFYETHQTAAQAPVRTRWGYRAMKPRDAALRLKRFEASEKARKVGSLETMILDFEHMASDLSRQIAAEEERTGIRDPAHFAYSTFAKAAALRRANLQTSASDLRAKLDAARAEHEEALSELRKLEPVETREIERPMRKSDPTSALIGG